MRTFFHVSSAWDSAGETPRRVTDYYVEYGWDAETGVPTAETLRTLEPEADAAFA